MKKNLPLSKTILSILFLTALSFSIKSQSLGISVYNYTPCTTTGTNNQVSCSVTSTVSGTAWYFYTLYSSCGSGTNVTYYGYFSASTTTANMNILCAGSNYTVVCNALNSSSVVIGTASATGLFNIATYPTININPNGGAGCLGTTFTINLSGVSNYTTFGGGIGTQTNSTIIVTPSTSSCFSVTASNGTCTTNSARCFTVYGPSSVSLSPAVAACSNSSYTLIPSGATSYTWNTGSTLPYLVVPPSVSACYTVTGSNPFCSGTSSAVTCVTSIPSPTLSYGASNSAICLGSSITFTASGASNYTWVISSGSNTISYNISNNVVFTPSVVGNYYAQIVAASGVCALNGNVTFTVSQIANVTIPSTYTVCSGYQVGLSPSGANNYTWSTGSNASTLYVTPLSSTCYTVTGSSNVCGGTSSAVTCVSVIASPSISVLGSTANCSGSFNTYTAIGGSGSYTWLHPFTFASYGTGSIVTIPPSSNGFAVLNSGTVTGCNVYGATVFPVYIPSPTITISSSNSGICSGSSATLTASGANTYTWSNSISSSSILISPTSSQCYTVLGQNTNGCYSSAVRCVTVMALPNISISGTTSACPGSNLVYAASGGTSYTWSNASTTSTINVNTNSSNCYSVTGWGTNGCSGTASRCFTSLPVPVISIAGSTSVCIGSSTTFTASGGTTYTWNTGANTSTLNVLPTASNNYTVKASHAINSCTSSAVVALTVYTTCAIVWPGDANRDGQVDNTDVFELGLAASSTGAARTSASNSWNGQFASAWSGTVSSGWNKVHADCNGDGTINANDTIAIGNNYSLTHAFKNASSSSAIDLFLVPQNSEVYGGLWNVVDIILGDASNTQSQIYGAAFDLDYDQTMVENNSVRIVYNASFLNSNNQSIEFEKTMFNAGKLYATSVRTDYSDVNGNGKIAEIWFKIKTGIPDNTSFNFGISNGKRTSANGVMGVLNTSGSMNLNLNNDGTGINEKTALSNSVRFYPNPVNSNITLRNDLNTKTVYRMFDLTGRMILSGEFTSSKTLDVSSINKGVYILEFETPNSKIQKKLVKE